VLSWNNRNLDSSGTKRILTASVPQLSATSEKSGTHDSDKTDKALRIGTPMLSSWRRIIVALRFAKERSLAERGPTFREVIPGVFRKAFWTRRFAAGWGERGAARVVVSPGKLLMGVGRRFLAGKLL
jgi:hypothetical protein